MNEWNKVSPVSVSCSLQKQSQTLLTRWWNYSHYTHLVKHFLPDFSLLWLRCSTAPSTHHCEKKKKNFKWWHNVWTEIVSAAQEMGRGLFISVSANVQQISAGGYCGRTLWLDTLLRQTLGHFNRTGCNRTIAEVGTSIRAISPSLRVHLESAR